MKRSPAPASPLQALVGRTVLCYCEGKRATSDGWHAGKLLKVGKSAAVVELRRKVTVPITYVREA